MAHKKNEQKRSENSLTDRSGHSCLRIRPVPKISVVIPVFNEQEVIAHSYEALDKTLRESLPGWDHELLYVNDGSTDRTAEELAKIYEHGKNRVRIIHFLRNFGQVPAILAGMRIASGDCTVIMSADLQDPPSLVPEMAREWESGNKLVLAVRESRDDPFFSRLTSGIFYGLMKKLVNVKIPSGGFDYFLMDRSLLDLLLQGDERNHFLQGFTLWPGHQPKYLFYKRQKRLKGASHWPFSKKIKYFIDGFIAYSFFPLRLVITAGSTAVAGGVLIFATCLIRQALNDQENGTGLWILASLWFLGGLQLIATGVIGEYLWRNLEQARKRPLYIIDSIQGATAPKIQNGKI